MVLDDADLIRSAIEKYRVTGDQLERAVEQLDKKRRPAVRAVVQILRHAVVDAPPRTLMGPAVWDHLMQTASRYGQDLVQLVEQLPSAGALPSPGDGADGYLTVESVDVVPPASLSRVLAALKEERDAFLINEDFNSRLRLGSGGVEVSCLKHHAASSKGDVYVQRMPLLILDATPIEVLVDHLTAGHKRLPDVIATITLPANVTVAQHASRANGHRTLSHVARLRELFEEVDHERRRYPVETPDQEAVICYKPQRQAFIDLGFAESQVLTYGSTRGTNALVGVRRLHIIGRPMPPGEDLVYLAQVIHHGDGAVDDAVVMRSAPYGGQPLAVQVVDYKDARVSELLHAQREDELLQVVHRARLLTLDPQGQLLGTGGRDSVRLVIHTSHPVPGLRVDELIRPAEDTRSVNDERSNEARNRILQARQDLTANGKAVTVNAVARYAKADKRTVSRVLGKVVDTPKDESGVTVMTDTKFLPSGKVVDTPKEESLAVDVATFPGSTTSSLPNQDTSVGAPAAAPADRASSSTIRPASTGHGRSAASVDGASCREG